MQFRLGTLVTAVTFIAGFCGGIHLFLLGPTLRKERAITAVKRLGGTVGYASPAKTPIPGTTIYTMYKPEFRPEPLVTGPPWAVRLFGERYFLSAPTTVEFLDPRNRSIKNGISVPPLTDADLVFLEDLPDLELLDLDHYGYISTPHGIQVGNGGCPAITDRAAEYIVQLKKLQFLNLNNSQFTDEGVLKLCQHLPRLRSVGLDGTKVSDASLDALAQLRELDVLCVRSTRVTSPGVHRFDARRPEVTFLQSVDAETNTMLNTHR